MPVIKQDNIISFLNFTAKKKHFAEIFLKLLNLIGDEFILDIENSSK